MKKIALFFCALALIVTPSACKTKNYLEKHISECRYNILEGEKDDMTVKMWLVKKESPYKLDGICQEVAPMMEIFLYVVDNTLDYTINFEYDGKNYGGQLNYNSVRRRHELEFSFPEKSVEGIDLSISYEGAELLIRAESIVAESILSPINALTMLSSARKERFDVFTQNGDFEGEIHLRLMQESGKCYYYVGLVNKSGKIYAYLLDAATAEILAEKEINYKTNLAVSL